jgi:uncharacterized damage-inducible protein DinB
MRRVGFRVLICLLAPVSSAFAQGNALSDTTRMMYGVMKQQMLLAAAEKMPEEAYAFKPVDSVRTYGQIVGHIADMQYAFCSIALGEKNPAPRVEQTKTSIRQPGDLHANEEHRAAQQRAWFWASREAIA